MTVRITDLDELRRVSAAFAGDIRRLDVNAPISGPGAEAWPTVGHMIDHLGTIQRWASAVVASREHAERAPFERAASRDRGEWFDEGAEGLLAALAAADLDGPCWTLTGTGTGTGTGAGTVGFWLRRMINEASKHLWDLRTATDPAPLVPDDVSMRTRADVIDEFADVFVSRARHRGIDRLPTGIELAASDAPDWWLVGPDWSFAHTPDVAPAARRPVDVVRVTARLGDLVLFVWDRAEPWRLTERFVVDGDAAALRAFRAAPVHV